MSDIKTKTLYTAYSRILAMVINVVSQFVMTPIILGFLGTTLYGIYTIVSKANNFLSIVDIRPTAILRLKLAHVQLSSDIADKRKYIGASYAVSALFMPIFIIGGCILAYFVSDLFHIEREFVAESRHAVILLSIFLATNGFWGIPEAILRGNNLEYKGFFIEPIRLLLYAAFAIWFLYLGWGILSVIYAMFLCSLFAYIARLILRNIFLPDFTALKPSLSHVKYFFRQGGWYMLSSFLMQIINNFDIILIGILMTPESVTLFAITKAIVFRLSESVETLITSTTSSIGEIVGSGDKAKMQAARMNIMNLSFPLALFITSYFFLFNKGFISLWTGSAVYAGDIVNSLICMSAIALMLTSTEEIFVISSLHFKKKTLCLLFSAAIAVLISAMLNTPLGLTGNAIGILAGRVALFILYSKYNNGMTGRRIRLDPLFAIKTACFIIALVFVKLWISEIAEWTLPLFVAASAAFAVIAGGYTYLFLFNKPLRHQILKLILRKT